MTYRTPNEAKEFREAVELVTRPLLERIEKLEAEVAELRKTASFSHPVDWGGHLPGKIEP